ncbi:MAG TPA: hypothetical protein VLB44_24105 [Kofleriaceae bacterium]|nr:hypothetical protein [Kofleriaceae bacterium]
MSADEQDEADRIKRGKLVRAQKDARQTLDRGVLLLGLVPVVASVVLVFVLAFGASSMFFLLILAGAYTLVGGVGGIALIASGGTLSRRLGRELRAIDERRQLPAARVVKR